MLFCLFLAECDSSVIFSPVPPARLKHNNASMILFLTTCNWHLARLLAIGSSSTKSHCATEIADFTRYNLCKSDSGILLVCFYWAEINSNTKRVFFKTQFPCHEGRGTDWKHAILCRFEVAYGRWMWHMGFTGGGPSTLCLSLLLPPPSPLHKTQQTPFLRCNDSIPET